MPEDIAINNFPLTAFGELSVAELNPVAQVTAQYGLRSDVLTVNLGGTTTSTDSKFVASTGTGINNVSAIVSTKQATYRAGQGLNARFTALFTKGKANSLQQAGFITSESSFAFGFNGVDFGILHSRDGAQEQQVLTITTPASGAENATITIDDVVHIVPLTAGTAEFNAYQIAVELESQSSSYDFSSVDNTVQCLARLPDFGGGAFTFSSATAIAAFSQVEAGLLPIETWVNKADWNVNPTIDIDPTLGNVYQIQLQYLGFGGIRFYIENPQTALYELVHIIRYANTSLVPSVVNPIFRVGWACRNTGNNTDIVVQGASGGLFIEGIKFFDGSHSASAITQPAIGTTLTSLFCIKNRLTFNGLSNRAEILFKAMNISTDTTKTGEFQLILNPVVLTGDSLNFSLIDSTCLAEIATDTATIVGGLEIGAANIRNLTPFKIDIQDIIPSLLPGDILCVAARVSSGAASEMATALSWVDDL